MRSKIADHEPDRAASWYAGARPARRVSASRRRLTAGASIAVGLILFAARVLLVEGMRLPARLHVDPLRLACLALAVMLVAYALHEFRTAWTDHTRSAVARVTGGSSAAVRRRV